MTQQTGRLDLTRDEIFFLKSMLSYMDDPEWRGQTLQSLSEKTDAAFERITKKKKAAKLRSEQMPLIDYLEGRK